MKRLLPLALLLLLLSPSSAAGDGCPPETCGVQSSAAPGSRLLVTRPQGILVAYDVVAGTRRFTLPPSIDAADGRSHFVSVDTSRATVVRKYDRAGRLVARWRLGPRRGLAVASANGRRLVLQSTQSRRRSSLELLDTRTGRTQPVELAGSFAPEALSNDGRRLFLIEYLPSGYRVRVYDVGRHALRAGELRPRNDDEPMEGFPAYAIGSPRGHWLLTLYVKPQEHEAFVHALDLRKAIAYCVDLPGHAPARLLGQWALGLGVGGTTLFASSPALGLTTQIDMRTLETAPAIRFPRSPEQGNHVNAAVSPRGDLVYVGGTRRLWAYDVRARRMRGPYPVGPAYGFGFTPDGRRLAVVAPGDRMFWLDAATGRKL